MQEVWKDISGYEGIYMVSNFGRIKSLKRKCECYGGVRSVPERIIKVSHNKRGYKHVCLHRYGISKNHDLHRIIATAFIPGWFAGAVVNHKDGVKGNNNIDNLEWVTIGYNNFHAKELGLLRPRNGINHERSIRVIDNTTGIEYESISAMAHAMSKSRSFLYSILKGRKRNTLNISYAS